MLNKIVKYKGTKHTYLAEVVEEGTDILTIRNKFVIELNLSVNENKGMILKKDVTAVYGDLVRGICSEM